MKFRSMLPAAAVLLVVSSLAFAQNNTFVTSIGDQVFPFKAPARDGSAGNIDNMVIGATTPRAGTFTSVTNTGGGAITADSITGTDASLGIAGQGAAQGGAVAIVGGASSTSANAGGAVTATGGTPGATGAGGPVTLIAGAGGATSGAGGAATLRGGAGTAGNAAGGAAEVSGGAGQGSAAGGAVTITGGAAGATGAGGAVNITAGALTAGNGANVTVTASAGAGGTNAGGSVNLVPGAAVSTGIPGKVQVNGDANLMCGTYFFTGTPAATNQVFYVANRAMIVNSIRQVHSAAAGGTSTLDITKDTGTTAPAGGTALTTAAFNLNATANTVQSGTLSATIATLTMAAGDRLAVKFNNAIQSSAGVVVTACMAPL